MSIYIVRSTSRWFALAAMTGLMAACASPSESAKDVLARSSATMGADAVKTLRYSGEGTGQTFGQAYVAGGPWPKVNYPSVVRSIDYEVAAMRDEVVLSRAEPQGEAVIRCRASNATTSS